MEDPNTYLAHLCMCDTCRYHRDRREEQKGYYELENAVDELVRVLLDHEWLWGRGDGEGGELSRYIRQRMEANGFVGNFYVWQPRPEVQKLADRDGWDCAYCGCALQGKPDRPIPHVDHVIPKSRGGSNALTNKVLACPTCNISKHARTPEEWYEALRGKEESNG
jgi:5-methylcytosine-specific restriction endonuclease McrA